MIVLAVLGFAIAVAFATANRSLLNARQAQENSEATALVQSQVEALRALSRFGTATTGVFDPALNKPFCIENVTAATPTIKVPTLATDCQYNNLYKVVIYPCDFQAPIVNTPCAPTNTDNNTFAVQATWPDVVGTDAIGGDTDYVTTLYRVHVP